MSREAPVRICERLVVKFHRPTRRFQTTSSCCGQNPTVVSVEEKAHEMRQVRIKKVSVELTNVSVESERMVSKLESYYCSKISLGET